MYSWAFSDRLKAIRLSGSKTDATIELSERFIQLFVHCKTMKAAVYTSENLKVNRHVIFVPLLLLSIRSMNVPMFLQTGRTNERCPKAPDPSVAGNCCIQFGQVLLILPRYRPT